MNDRRLHLVWGGVAVLIAGSLLYLTARSLCYVLLGDAQSMGAMGEARLWSLNIAATAGFFILWAVALVLSRRRMLPYLLIYFAVVFFAAWPLGKVLASGDWASTQWFAPMLRWAPSVLLGVGASVLGGLLLKFPGSSLWATILPLAGVGVLVADQKVLPGLYLHLHAALYLTAAGLIFHGVASLMAKWRLGSRPPLLILVVLVLAGTSYWAFKTPAEIRILLENEAPTVEHILGLVQGRKKNQDLTSFLDHDSTVAPVKTLKKAVEHDGTVAVKTPKKTVTPPGKSRALVPIDNIVLIVIDALRADALPPSRKPRQPFAKKGDTPFLDGLVARSYRFERAYSQSSKTQISVPSMFRSLEPFEKLKKTGVSLASQMRSLGRRTIAVIPQYFVISGVVRTRNLLDDFDQVEVIDKQKQDTAIDQAKRALSEAKGSPFFAWIHPYNMHSPYYSGRLTTKADGSPAKRYRLALKWLDGEMKRLFDFFEAKGLMARSAFIITADHGEFLGKRKTGHGVGVSEIETRVPLFVLLPGLAGGLRKPVVGNIDIVPTMIDLMGYGVRRQHRGKSLVPLILDPATPWERTYYLRNGNQQISALVQGDQKLIYHQKTGLFKRFNVRWDKRQRKNLYTGRTSKDRELTKIMFRRNPAIIAADLQQNKDVPVKLVAQFAEYSASQPDERLHYMLRVAKIVPTAEVLKAAESLFERTSSLELKLTIFEALNQIDRTHWRRLLGRVARSLKTSEERQGFIDLLAQRNLPRFAGSWFRKQIKALAKAEEMTRWVPWLQVVRRWPKRKAWKRTLRALSAIARKTEPEPKTLGLLLRNIGSLRGRGKGFSNFVESMFKHGDLEVERAACYAMEAIRSKNVVPMFRSRLTEPDLEVRLKKSVLYGLMKLQGEESVDILIKAAEDPVVMLHVILLLRKIRSEKAVPFLKKVAATHYNEYTWASAKRAQKWIKKKK